MMTLTRFCKNLSHLVNLCDSLGRHEFKEARVWKEGTLYMRSYHIFFNESVIGALVHRISQTFRWMGLPDMIIPGVGIVLMQKE